MYKKYSPKGELLYSSVVSMDASGDFINSSVFRLLYSRVFSVLMNHDIELKPLSPVGLRLGLLGCPPAITFTACSALLSDV